MTRPLHIAIVTGLVTRNNGQGRINYEIVRAALHFGHRVTVIAGECAPDLLSDPQLRFLRASYSWLPTQLLRNVAMSLSSFVRVSRAKDVDLIQADGFITWSRSDLNVAHMVHSRWLHSPLHPFRRWWRSPYAAYQRFYTYVNAKLERAAFSRSRVVVAISPKIASELESIGVDPRKIRVITNGVDISEFHPGYSDRSQFALPTNTALLLFAGDIRTPLKNLDTVLKALVGVPDVHLAVAGTIDHSRYPKLARQMGLTNRVHFLGRVTNMGDLMRCVDALVFPSRYDALGMVILEAMATGIPVITSSAAGGATLLAEGGIVIDDPNDDEALARWMRLVVRDPLFRSKMGRAGLERSRLFTTGNMTQHYLDLYGELCGRIYEPTIG